MPCVAGNGVVIHLPGLFEEAEKNEKKGTMACPCPTHRPTSLLGSWLAAQWVLGLQGGEQSPHKGPEAGQPRIPKAAAVGSVWASQVPEVTSCRTSTKEAEARGVLQHGCCASWVGSSAASVGNRCQAGLWLLHNVCGPGHELKPTVLGL